MTTEPEDGEAVAREWLTASARTANAKDHAAHMDLVSKNVKVFGVPGFDVLGYDDWARQCEHEFAQGILSEVAYAGLKVIAASAQRVMFKTVETVKGADGGVNQHGVEIILEREPDGKWRVTQERVLSPEEAAHDRL